MAQRAAAATNLTVEEFMVFPTPDGKAELVRGELRVPRFGAVRRYRLTSGQCDVMRRS
jgi:hypothetical protein